jgi:hypothetical protein
MDPRHFLTHAALLVRRVQLRDGITGQGEAECRSAISRGYYASHLIAIDRLAEIGLRLKGGPQNHQLAEDCLLNSGETDLRKAGSQLGSLGTERRIADYKMTNPKPEKFAQARELVELSRKTIGLLDSWLASANLGTKRMVTNKIWNWADMAGKKSLLERI